MNETVLGNDATTSPHGAPTVAAGIAVVLAHRHGHGDVALGIDRVVPQLGPHDRLIIVADRPLDTNSLATVVVRHGALVPELWATGIGVGGPGRIAMCSSAVLVDEDWLAAVRRGASSWAAAGGTIGDVMLRSKIDRAMYLVRFARHRQHGDPLPRACVDLAADNAWYDRAALEQITSSFAAGFWEPFVHDRLVANGRSLVRDPSVRAEMIPGIEFRAALRQRVDHGRRHGRRWGSTRRRRTVALTMVGTALVPVAMTFRAIRASNASYRSDPVVVAIAFVLFAGWAAGEFIGRAEHLIGRSPSTSDGHVARPDQTTGTSWKAS